MAVEKMEFQTESKELLNLMINSIYSNKEIFLRELISNASDAIDKRKYQSLISEGKYTFDEEPTIRLIVDKNNNSLTIKDNGVGMNKEELVQNIGTIAKSGSKEFVSKLKEAKEGEEIDIIGQFGVGFYSAFMVAKKIIVETKSYKDDAAYKFESDGNESYTIEDIDKTDIGTSITLILKDDTDDVNYSNYLTYPTIEYLVKKYSNYIKYPVKMEEIIQNPRKDNEGKVIEGEYDESIEDKILNSMVPLWKKSKKDVTEEELNEFYKTNFHDYIDPLYSIQFNVEGMASYQALIFVPSRIKNEVYNREDAGLSLYAKNVFIMEKCKDLLPHYLYFLDGVVDSNDLSLNISREMLQQDKNIKRIRDNIENKLISNFKDLKENDKEKYIKIYELFGTSFKYGIYENYGSKNELLKDLLVFKSLKHEDEYIDFKTYVSEMKDGQKNIYFASGETIPEIKLLPEMQKFKKDDIDVLFFDKDVDEFAIRSLFEYDKHEFKSISEKDENDLTEEEKSKIDELNATYKRQLDTILSALEGKVSEVKFSTSLVDYPVSISNKDGLSLNMEKIINNINQAHNETNMYQSEKVLEINPDHPIFNKIASLSDEEVKVYAKVLYNEALLLGGLEVKDKEEFTKALNELLLK